ncbi:Fe-S cluster assembly protein SufD [Paenibacillus macquariensis]|uniref:Fe-S cluster assembly protein SufD n=1 Tax=Paenibacillus macquariensis TaxID=948756 RepID=A0ABY1JWW3_9BACL|nr:Fe-S cluster assembly protein SufD [Paenibacillus macquariensis]MEC0089401.1 Fe-S cluster assembly protein SufD [Paenibacillus macquariensis]OAB33211.1 Fe-S cluster assembly protein SufD [Paenibacillus macquariensis subsp. macquariensis]SIQ92065.1 Fe-S cluster assembly protein SufD [Paenibacillus macquariensis]
MTTQTILPVNTESLKEISLGNNEPAWLTELRLEALELAGQLELPRLEKTRIDRWNTQTYGAYQATTVIDSLENLPTSVQGLIKEENLEGSLIVQHNSGVVYTHLSAELAKQGIIFMDLHTAASEHGDLVKSYLHKAIEKGENAITALHAALWNGGVFLYVPKNVEVTLPLQAIFLTDEVQSTFAPHILIIADTNSSVTYVDNYVSGEIEGNVVHNGSVEVFVKAGAKVRYATVHQLGDQVTDLSYRRAIVENDGVIEWIVGEMNDGNTMSDTSSILKGNGASTDAKIIAVGSGAQKLNYTTRAQHFGKNTPSQMITRAVLREQSTAIINGITKIEHGASKADGQQTEKVLMLSPKARGDANPILLIDEDDVTAGHAASVGQVNAEQVYYLMSRGISRIEAEALIIYGFLAPVVSQIPLEGLRTQLQALVERKLGR